MGKNIINVTDKTNQTESERFINFIESNVELRFSSQNSSKRFDFLSRISRFYGFFSKKQPYYFLRLTALTLSSEKNFNWIEDIRNSYKIIQFDKIFCAIIKDKDIDLDRKYQLLILNLILERNIKYFDNKSLFSCEGTKFNDQYFYFEDFLTITECLNTKLKNGNKHHNLTSEECQKTVEIFRKKFPYYKAHDKAIDEILKDYPVKLEHKDHKPKSGTKSRYMIGVITLSLIALSSLISYFFKPEIFSFINIVKDKFSKSKENISSMVITPNILITPSSDLNLQR